jgi:hypothetical protein
LIWEFDLLLLLLAAAWILSITNSVRKYIPTALGQNRLLPNRPGSGTTKLQLLSLWAFWRDYQTFSNLQFHEIFPERLPDLLQFHDF